MGIKKEIKNFRCKREGCDKVIRPGYENYEDIMSQEYGQKGYCSESCMITDEDGFKCPNCNVIMIFNPSRREYACPKCDCKREIKIHPIQKK